MPYLADGSLADAIHARLRLRLDLPTAFLRVTDYVSQLAEALQYTHDCHIVHRDVKPGNVLIEVQADGHWHLFLSDFGIARNLETTSQEHGWHGTVAYMAPEQFRGEVSPAADQYGLAVLAFQLLSGQLPFGMTPPAIRTLNPVIAASVERVLLRALAVHPEERFASVSAFATALQTAGGTTELTEPFSTHLPQPLPTYLPPTDAQTMRAAHADGTTQPAEVEPNTASAPAWQNQSPQGASGQKGAQPPPPNEATPHQEHHDDSGSPSRFRWVGGRRYLVDSDIIWPADPIMYQFMEFEHYIDRKTLGTNHVAPLDQPTNILHVTDGTVRWVVEMAVEFPNAQVVGFEFSPLPNIAPVLAPLGDLASHVSFIEGDVTKGLPFPEGTFDYVFMRYVSPSIPAAHWPRVIAELVRVLRPGGWVEVRETALAVHDPGPAYAQGGAWIAELLRRRGMDSDLGPKLRHLLEGANLQPVIERVNLTFPNVRRKRERRLWQTHNIGLFDRIYRGPILEAGIATASKYDDFLAALRREFEVGQHANSDIDYIVYGQRRS
jgi:SAM-dependent methyltransferase